MFFLMLLSLVGMGSCEEKFSYRAVQLNTTLTVQPENNFTRLSYVENGWPTGIEYLTEITEASGLMVRAIFGDKNGPLDVKRTDDSRMNICEILAKALDQPDSAQARYNMPEALGLSMTRCPIEKGIKVLGPYNFPTEFATKDLGCGSRYWQMRVETPDQGLNTEAMLTLHVEVELTKNNETCTESSSSAALVPGMMATLALGLCIYKLSNRVGHHGLLKD